MPDDFLELLVSAHEELAGRLELHVHTIADKGVLLGDDPRVELAALERVLGEHRADLDRLRALRESEIQRYDELIKDREAGVRELEKRVKVGERDAARRGAVRRRSAPKRKPGK
jgi:hypothetical protein